MRGLGTWAKSLVTMVSVAAIVLFVTGWGSALGSTMRSAANAVFVTNTAKSPVPVKPVGVVPVTSANHTVVIFAGGPDNFPANWRGTLFGGLNVSAYKSVTLYWTFTGGVTPADEELQVFADDPNGPAGNRSFGACDGTENNDTSVCPLDASTGHVTFDPAPPVLSSDWANWSTHTATVKFMLVGRTN